MRQFDSGAEEQAKRTAEERLTSAILAARWVEPVKAHIDSFIASYNQNARPFVWTKARSSKSASNRVRGSMIPRTSVWARWCLALILIGRALSFFFLLHCRSQA